ncbi:hypothetical protein LTR62_003877 [Meristemomyces frigidus]|uniref:Uncharacterized protein n=1 Tax=Meristemomyces frigidus TaxID=1508187 RepID=A0AAN7TEF5_9PEZI|nr:hypothetical protein LTR62_003877 [Meristemomyces frigidus]
MSNFPQHPASRRPSQTSTSVVPETFCNTTPMPIPSRSITTNSHTSDADFESHNNVHGMAELRARQAHMTETMQQTTWLLQRRAWQQAFTNSELAREQANNAQLQQERDIAVALADCRITEKDQELQKATRHSSLLSWAVIAIAWLVGGYVWWCWYNSPGMVYIRRRNEEFFGQSEGICA